MEKIFEEIEPQEMPDYFFRAMVELTPLIREMKKITGKYNVDIDVMGCSKDYDHIELKNDYFEFDQTIYEDGKIVNDYWKLEG